MSSALDDLETIFLRERFSLLQYARNALPYAKASERPLVEQLNQLADSTLSEVQQLEQFLQAESDQFRAGGNFPASFTNYNYQTIKSLLQRVLEDYQTRCQSFTENGRHVDTAPQVAKWHQRLQEIQQRTLTELQNLVASCNKRS
ncbi:MAG: hypothetical protein R3B84_02280 [Zavarzinella sp.]